MMELIRQHFAQFRYQLIEEKLPIEKVTSNWKAPEGTNRTLIVSKKWEEQKTYVREKLSEEETTTIYRQRKLM